MKNFAWWKWIIVGILGLVVWQFVINTGFISVKIIRGLSMVETLGSWLQTISSLMGLVILLVGLHFVYRWPGNGLQVIGLTRENWQKDVVIGMGVGLFKTVMVLFIFIPIMRDNAEVLLEPARAFSSSPIAVVNGLVLMIVFGGIVEELFFRGHIITSARHALGNKTWSIGIAVILSVGLFAATHSSYSLIAMGVVAAGGVLFSALYLWTGRLTASMFAHASYDVATFTGIYFIYPVGSVG